MPALSSDALFEVAAWMQRWQPDRYLVADPVRSRIVAEVAGAVVVYEAEAVHRLIPKRRS
ncbi:hypothetical protein [Nonomuraea bangladeshensis]|uniref:hypothetical protein n=1 Tax=Nonomuraea bangladeshensis TaxID=404385 RepID=UPI003C2BECB9